MARGQDVPGDGTHESHSAEAIDLALSLDALPLLRDLQELAGGR